MKSSTKDSIRTMFRWIHPTKRRYYIASPIQDLFGDWALVVCWGGLDSHLGGTRTVWAASVSEIERQIAAISRRRQRHGYVEAPARPLS
ncbi:WGR domain-containing protein [Allochromatium humboldtianum]